MKPLKKCWICKGTGEYTTVRGWKCRCPCLTRRPQRKPVSDVAKALNYLRSNSAEWCHSDTIAEQLTKYGFKIRWDAKKGRFV